MLPREYSNRLVASSDVDSYVDWLMSVIAEDEAVLSFVPEKDAESRRSRLRSACESLLAKFPDRNSRPELFAVPIGVKDIINVDGLDTRAGSALPQEAFAGSQASVVSLLVAAGAIILGKTVTAEFACMEPNATRNPRNLSHTPGGSSSGSAAAVAAGFCPIALGTQTVGSIIRPAAFCGVFGFKASFGRIPTDGILYYSRSTDHVGLLANSIEALKVASSCLVEDWNNVATKGESPKLGIPIGAYLAQVDPLARESFETSIAELENMGITTVRIPMLEDIDLIARNHRDMTSCEFSREHDSLYQIYGALYRPISSSLVRQGRNLGSDVIERGQGSQKALRDRIEALMDEFEVDAIVCPSAVGIAPKSQRATGDPAMNLPWTHAGLPVVNLPAASLPVEGGDLPLGLQLVGRFGEDERLLDLLESVSGLLSP